MEQTASANGAGTIDKAGAIASWICAAHCLAAPLLVSAGIVAGTSLIADGVFEYLFVGISVAIAGISLVPSMRRHRRLFPVASFIGGLALILLADLVPPAVFVAKLAVACAGASLISFAHLSNRRLNRFAAS